MIPNLCKVLHIAAGFKPLVASDLEQTGFLDVDMVVNYDPLNDGRFAGTIAGFTSDHSDLFYSNTEDGVNKYFPHGSFDLIIGVSPYGFPLVTTWADRKLKPGGYVLVVANSSNAYATKDNKLFESGTDLKNKYREIGQGEAGGWIDWVVAKIKQDYPSCKTDLGDPTPLNWDKKLLKTPTINVE